jgi:hypothetical protein
MRLTFALLLSAIAVLALRLSMQPAAAADLLYVASNVSYQIQPELGPVHISWQVTVENKDPETASASSGTTLAYDSLVDLPILRGATEITAQSADGIPLSVSLDDSGEGPVLGADVAFDRPLFYQESYSFTLDYNLADIRSESLLVTPFYVFLPAVASGDQATVTISTPTTARWEVVLEPVDCTQDGATFACSGTDTAQVAALAEVSRPDAVAITAIDIALRERNAEIALAYFRGDEPWARHIEEVATIALPIIEELYGIPYPGPSTINLAERGRPAIFGYGGLTSCNPSTACNITVSPFADDLTILHELAHLWSDNYSVRWLSEGFAELIAVEAASRLPQSLLQGEPPTRPESTLDLRLDEWEAAPVIDSPAGAEIAIEEAGYDRSWRLLLFLRDRVGLEALQQANASIAESGEPVGSRLFMDALEEVSGQNLDDLFSKWVFPDSLAPILEARREARDRLATVSAQALAEGLSPGVPAAIEEDVVAWRFGEALAALDRGRPGPGGTGDRDVHPDERRPQRPPSRCSGRRTPLPQERRRGPSRLGLRGDGAYRGRQHPGVGGLRRCQPEGEVAARPLAALWPSWQQSRCLPRGGGQGVLTWRLPDGR